MTVVARFDLKLDAEDKDLLSRAASLMGTTMAGFVRSAAKEKAQTLLEQALHILVQIPAPDCSHSLCFVFLVECMWFLCWAATVYHRCWLHLVFPVYARKPQYPVQHPWQCGTVLHLVV